MKTFKERLEYGEEAELVICRTLELYQIQYKRNIDISGWTPKRDKTDGDIYIYFPNKTIRFDSKRQSISLDSIQSFKGDYFVISNYNLSLFKVCPSQMIKNYAKTCHKNNSGIISLPSGDLGIKFNPLKLRNGINLTDWCKQCSIKYRSY